MGEGTVFTAGSAWIVDLAPPGRRGRVIGLYGLAVWSGLSIGPSIGEWLYHASGFHLVWAFAAAAPVLGALVALRIPDPFKPSPHAARGPLIARESVRPGFALSLASVGYAAMASFIVLDLQAHGDSHGAIAFTVFAATVVLTRLLAGDLPDRVGPLRCAAGRRRGRIARPVPDRAGERRYRWRSSARRRWGPPSRCSIPRSRSWW